MRHHAAGHQLTAWPWRPLSQTDIRIEHTKIYPKFDCYSMNSLDAHTGQAASPDPKPKGYNKLASLMGPNSEVAIFHRFGSLNMFSLLSMQAELTELERKFTDIYLDDSASDIEPVNHFCRNFAKLRASEGTEHDFQLQMLESIKTKLAEYNAALVLASEVANLEKPGKADVSRLREWLKTDGLGDNFLAGTGTESFTWDTKNEGDFVVLSAPPSDNEPLLPALSSLPLDLLHCCLRRKRSRAADVETGVLMYNDIYLRRFNKLIVTLVASLLPIVAIIVLYAVKGTWRRICVAIAFTALFGIAMACTTARQSEIFAATAAFAAVEVVFIGSVSGN
ncbi:hypothetical protein HBI79_053650 [Parastagonospora nodorum]|nr:hypothetical protein HBI79_053650 [Parastagonospora nodorum]